MRILLQRTRRASVTVEGQITGQIGQGLLLLACAAHDDGPAQIERMVRKISDLRIFADEQGKFNHSLLEIGGAILLVSQFTLYADCRHGRRPSFSAAAPAPEARRILEELAESFRARGIQVETGVFGAMMEVELINDGPVTIWLDSEEI